MKERTDPLSTDVVHSLPSVRFSPRFSALRHHGEHKSPRDLSRLHTHPSPYPTERTLSPSLAYQTHDCLPEKKPTTNTPRQHKKKRKQPRRPSTVLVASSTPCRFPFHPSCQATSHRFRERWVARPSSAHYLRKRLGANSSAVSPLAAQHMYCFLPPCALRGRNTSTWRRKL
jgi:hypothetical protein